ncbi:MAG: DEAD/DEAH box helicase family protein [Eggerthellaceae bacterium]|nr:DEAD/DEAH box helicase family protein [Eggerthellaceae bacterium]
MVKRIMYDDGEGNKPAVTDFDLVIVDEAHRGYILDKEMTEEESLYRDQRDYQSKYRAVIDYFDAMKIALTATPALHTTQIFGAPVFQ